MAGGDQLITERIGAAVLESPARRHSRDLCELPAVKRGRAEAGKRERCPDSALEKVRIGSGCVEPFDGANLQVTLDKPAHMQVITKCGVTAWGNSNKMSFSVPAADREKYGYLRVRAYARDGSEEIIFSQPMMLT